MSAENPQKRQKLSESSDLDDSKLDAETQKALEAIDGCQSEIDTLNEKASEEILLVEQKYNKLRKPLYGKRNKLISTIPNFWVTAFSNHPQISVHLTEDDDDCLQSLTEVEVEEFEDIKSGYRIKLHFAENEFFKNKVLSKEFHLSTTGSDGSWDPVSESTEIQWKKGKKPASPKGKGKRKHDMLASFFQWFADNTNPSMDELAEVIKDDMWPSPLQYFLSSDIDAENGMNSDDDDDEDDNDITPLSDGEGDGDDEDDDDDDEEGRAEEDDDEED
ncbi:hypothetical protein CAPTEDRAFT_157590 [Capitella teleta]|uniref:Uncharacterized protein n=1 Tax=Capitella teleta TaxID=283909 RepID=R7U0Q1_CAPTE|nr:hypothetical protein CAPTEDRAFT_157590 [Capitella teleta]|eukprot:ELT99437.1 hypothetical protein CAPTEDRAFT_157590 [Capitella teleta]